MRIFLAVRLTDAVRDQIDAVIQPLARVGADVTWVELQNLHLTLRFLGEMTQEQRAVLEQALEARSRSQPPFTVMFAGVGGFPSLDRPRVLWVGVTQGHESLKPLAHGIETACQAAGFPPADRPLSEHVTIGRVRSVKGLARLLPALRSVSSTSFGGMTVDHCELIQSQRSHGGPMYATLREFPL